MTIIQNLIYNENHIHHFCGIKINRGYEIEDALD